MRVRDVMSAQVYTISPSDTAQSAARLMAATGVGALPVEAAGVGAVIGIVTDRDIVLATLSKGRATSTTVCEFMTVSAEVCEETMDIHSAADRMARLQLRRLVVVNDAHQVVGVLSQSDLTYALPELTDRFAQSSIAPRERSVP
ncbi:CBS domain-containing protein [Sinorhizobium sp. BG8]|uniref:CBS domain-containing protein n=1 Tax=Sinorhizobium sp. BG8 TaxID=2613773 RepID=UPI00193E5FF8|nr:CBS domain-containing protein [Sinorhizobium sp. BG8]QRM57386.1 CBS domain-containing protein [Sinorhizobium sp. BG8]